MNREDFLHELMGKLDDDLILDAAVVKRSRQNLRNIVVGAVVIVGVLLFLCFYDWAQVTRYTGMALDSYTGEIQDGAYYTYGDKGIVRYAPGQEPELIVPAEDRAVNGLYEQWGVNSLGVYYADWTTLWRMDPDTGEEVVLYHLDSDLTDPEAPTLTLEHVGEAEIVLELWENGTAAVLHLDPATGEPLGDPIPWPEGVAPRAYSAGERVLWSIQQEYPEDFLYPGSDLEQKEGISYRLELLENGVSLLPEGTVGDHMISQLHNAVCQTYFRWTEPDAEGLHQRSDYGYLLVTETDVYDLPDDFHDRWIDYQAVTDDWLWFFAPLPEGSYDKCLWVRNLDTGEDRLLQERFFADAMATDGQHLYRKYQGEVTCWQINTDADGHPIGITLVETRT